MKSSKLFLTIFACAAFLVVSCSTSDDALLQDEENFLIEETIGHIESEEDVTAAYRVSTAIACTYFNANPFTEETETFGCGDPPAPNPKPGALDRTAIPLIECFPALLKLHVPNDFEDQILDGTTFVQEFSTSFNYGSEFVFFSDRGVPLNACLFPFIQPDHANIMFRSISCEIQDYFETLPTLPSNQFYYPEMIFLNSDFNLGGGPHSDSSYVNFSLSVKIWEVN